MGESSHVKKYRTKYLNPSESVVATAEGYIGSMMGSGKDTQHNGALIVTNKTVAFYRGGIFGEVHQHIPLDKITSVEQSSTLGHRTLRMHTSHDDLTFKTLNGAEYSAVVAAVEAGRKANHSTPNSTQNSPLDALKSLGELRAAGVINDTEFESKKRELLQRI